MKQARTITAMLLVLLLFIQGCTGGNSGVQVVTEKIKSGTSVSTDSITGKIEAQDSVTILPKIGGKVSLVAVEVGSRVTAGQVLMKIDMSDVEAIRNQYSAAVKDAEAGVKKARVDYEIAQANYQRALALYQSGALSKSDFENKYALPFETSRIQAEETTPFKLAQAKAALQSVDANYSNSVITSPINGVVTARYINPGEVCSPGKPLFFVANLSKLDVVSYVDDKKINSLHPGQKVAVKVDSVERILEAEVKTISDTLDPVAKGYQVKFLLNEEGLNIKPGMFARIDSDTSSMKQFVVPKSSLTEEKGGYGVFLYDSGKVIKVPVKVEKMSDKFAVIGNGLKEGQEIVVYSSAKLENGMKVHLR